MAARSSKGAIGIMQLMPDTARDYGVNPYDAQQNIMGGTAYLNDLMKRYHGNELEAVGAYNMGQGNMDKFLAGKMAMPEETKNYIAKVLAQEGRSGGLTIGSVTIQITQRPGESQQALADRVVAKLRDADNKQVQRNLQAQSNFSPYYVGG
jgi:hypothetical protein